MEGNASVRQVNPVSRITGDGTAKFLKVSIYATELLRFIGFFLVYGKNVYTRDRLWVLFEWSKLKAHAAHIKAHPTSSSLARSSRVVGIYL